MYFVSGSPVFSQGAGEFMFKKKKRRSKEFKNSSQIIDIEDAREQRRRKRVEATDKKSKGRKTKIIMTERRAGKRARRRMVYLIIFLVIIGIIGASAFNIVSLKMNQAKIEKQQEDLLKQKARLENELLEIDSPEYIEQQARQQLKMIKPGELLYVLPDKSKGTTSTGIIPE